MLLILTKKKPYSVPQKKIVMFKIKRPTTIHRCFLSYQTYTCGISHKLSTCAYL